MLASFNTRRFKRVMLETLGLLAPARRLAVFLALGAAALLLVGARFLAFGAAALRLVVGRFAALGAADFTVLRLAADFRTVFLTALVVVDLRATLVFFFTPVVALTAVLRATLGFLAAVLRAGFLAVVALTATFLFFLTAVTLAAAALGFFLLVVVAAFDAAGFAALLLVAFFFRTII